MSWWQDFFDADYLRFWADMLTPERTRREAEAIPRMLGLPAGSTILDVPCGYGRLATPLAEAGYRVVGVDYSADMLRRVTGVEILRGDMRRLPLAGPFDAVLNWFTSIGYFEDERDNLAALTEFARVLRPGGLLLMELNHRDAVARNFAERSWFEAQGMVVTVERRFDVLAGRTRERLRWQEGGAWRTREFSCRVYAASEVASMLASVGLAVESAWGGTDLSPFTHASPRLALLARKP
jgi:SAM-dependent methyltransferase